ncbi:phosphate ABC transporter substrate-binding protein PstS [Asticcacaulis sp. EMRT-3]|uniref:phosphate ABC transporter substrate-binding protein PstS n=1 Tax=Asticcacaulis sp. EMRT-3 TaxID=3040349 RepID=UPI0024AEA480|nr:phosphate ABC transporter substrate-binding protein PstS [Asticcacaulis sp. EMRT-3]MDI7776096.1 phosphate ABC transporter substrate-binding protein PstS [Asticcacaulis sp. EMRT-3]
MFKFLTVAAVAALIIAPVASTATAAGTISGAGSTFAAPLYAKWAEGYKATTGSNLNYQAIGSGGGIKQIEANTVDFGGTDKPLTEDVLAQNGLYQFPTAVGGVVPAINVPGIPSGKLKLSGQTLADIYQGKITKWNDPAIARFNAGLALPNLPITVVHRSDGSGTTFIFTTYLSVASADWKAKVGANDSVEWPVGVGGKGSDGVAALVRGTVGSIGFVEYSYVQQTHINFALVASHDATWPQPTAENFKAATAGADWAHAPGNYLMIVNQPGKNAWPISGATFALVHKAPNAADAAKVAGVLKFFDYGFKNGDTNANDLFYVPLPASVKTLIRKQWASQIQSGGKPVYVSPNK